MTDRAKEIADCFAEMRLFVGLWLFGLVAGERGRNAMLRMSDAAVAYHSRILQGEIDG